MSSEPERRDEPPPLEGAVMPPWRDERQAAWVAVLADGTVSIWLEAVTRPRWIVASDSELRKEARRRLAAALVERDRELHQAVKVLRDVEWGPEPAVPGSCCPWCLRTKKDGHDRYCEIGNRLAAYDARRAPAPAAAKDDEGDGKLPAIKVEHSALSTPRYWLLPSTREAREALLRETIMPWLRAQVGESKEMATFTEVWDYFGAEDAPAAPAKDSKPTD